MRIVCFGDSVTRGISYVQGRLRILKENYPALLENTLNALKPVQVLNKGVFNDNSTRLVDRLEKDVIAESPTYVLIEIGGNDCNFQWDEVAAHPNDTHQPVVPLQTYLVNVEKMVEQIRRAGAVPVMMSLIPLDPVRYYRTIMAMHGSAVAHWIALCGGIEHWHAIYNRALERLAEKLNVLTIDVRRAFQRAVDPSILISDDGIHPTAHGYSLMSEVVRDWFCARLTVSGQIMTE